MRNLKRALSLALASVMLLGMMVTGANALSFQDADEISNVTAATVLEELGIMVGDGTNFHPEQTVTRAEMAVIVCTILYGERLNVNQFVDGSKFTDVPADHWANGYVNLANSLNIIVGYGDGTFGPNDPVTTAQATLMLTKALGWFQADELVDNWTTDSMTIVTKGTQIGLFGDLKLANNEGLKRDNVAELTFNAITKAVPVMYNSTWNVYYTDSQNVLGGTKFDYRDTLGYENFDLAYDTGSDDFGRPTTRWGIGTIRGGVDAQGNLLDKAATLTEAFVEVSKPADFTFTEKVTFKQLSDIIGRGNVRSYTWTINGGTSLDGNDDIDWTDDDNAVDDGAVPTPIVTGNGVLTQIYLTESGSGDNVTTTAEMFITPYYVAKVDGNYNSSKGELRIVSVDEANDLPAGTKTTLSNDDFGNLSTFVDEDYVLVTVASNNEVQSIELAEVITGNVDSFVSTKNVTVDGKQYKYTKNYRDSEGIDEGYKLDTDYNVVLDKFGYVIFADGVGADDNYLYVNDSGTLGGASKNVEVEAIFPDGTKKNVTLHNDSQGNLDIDNPTWAAGSIDPMWYEYEMKSGKYLLDDVTSGDTSTVSSDAFYITENGKTVVKYNDSQDSVPANSGTTFIVMKGDAISVYTGVRNVPDVKAKSGGNVTVAYVKDENDTYADYVFIQGGKTDLSSSGSAAGEYIFIVDASRVTEKKHSNGEDTVYVYEAVVNGEERAITSTSNSWSVGLYTDVTYDGEYVDDMTPVASEDDFDYYDVKAGTRIDFKKSVLSWDGVNAGSVLLAEGCKVWTSDGDDLEASSGAGLKSDYGADAAQPLKGEIFLVLKNNQATEVYVFTKVVAAPVTPGTPENPEELDTTTASTAQETLNNAANGTVFEMNNAKLDDETTKLNIPAGVQANITGTTAGGEIKSSAADGDKAAGKVVLNATVGGDLDATEVKDLELKETTVAAGATLSVSSVKVSNTVTLTGPDEAAEKEAAVLEIAADATITKGDTGAIEGEDGGQIQLLGDVSGNNATNLKALAGKFYKKNADSGEYEEVTSPIPAGTYTWHNGTLQGTRGGDSYENDGWYNADSGTVTPDADQEALNTAKAAVAAMASKDIANENAKTETNAKAAAVTLVKAAINNNSIEVTVEGKSAFTAPSAADVNWATTVTLTLNGKEATQDVTFVLKAAAAEKTDAQKLSETQAALTTFMSGGDKTLSKETVTDVASAKTAALAAVKAVSGVSANVTIEEKQNGVWTAATGETADGEGGSDATYAVTYTLSIGSETPVEVGPITFTVTGSKILWANTPNGKIAAAKKAIESITDTEIAAETTALDQAGAGGKAKDIIDKVTLPTGVKINITYESFAAAENDTGSEGSSQKNAKDGTITAKVTISCEDGTDATATVVFTLKAVNYNTETV